MWFGGIIVGDYMGHTHTQDRRGEEKRGEERI